jgi:hypothetical protein
MGRASLLQVSRERIQALSDSAPPAPEQPQSRTDLATLCVDAAKATIELIRNTTCFAASRSQTITLQPQH